MKLYTAIFLTIFLNFGCGNSTPTQSILDATFQSADTAAVLLVAPAIDQITGKNPEFRFIGRYGAMKYQIVISENVDLSDPVLEKILPSDRTSYTLQNSDLLTASELAETNYFWQVRAEYTDGLVVASETRMIQILEPGVVYVNSAYTEDIESGNRSYPFKNIQKALASANQRKNSDATVTMDVRVAAGDYTGRIYLLPGVKLLGGYDPHNDWSRDPEQHVTTIQAATNDQYTVLGDNSISPEFRESTVVDGFSIEGGNVADKDTFAVFLSQSSPTITNNKIQGGNGTVSIGVQIASASKPRVAHNTITSASATSKSIGIMISASAPEITFNTITAGNGAASSPGVSCGVEIILKESGGSKVVLTDNTITASSAHTSYGIALFTSSDSEITDNIINGGNGSQNSYGISAKYSGIEMHRIFTKISGNTVHGGNGGKSYGMSIEGYSNASIHSNVIHGGSGTSDSYGIANFGSNMNVSDNSIFGGQGNTSHGIISNGSVITYFYRNNINGGAGASESYGLKREYNATGQMFLISNVITGGSGGVNSFGIKTDFMSLLKVFHNTVDSGSGATAYAYWNITGYQAELVNNHLLTSGRGTRYGIYEGHASLSEPLSLKNNNFGDLGSGGSWFPYRDADGTCSGSPDNNCTTVANMQNDINAEFAGRASGNISVNNSANQLFMNAPLMYDTTRDGPDGNTLYDGTTSTLEVSNCTNGRYVLNEYLEYNNDGIARQITEVNCTASTSIITFTPPLASASIARIQITLWGTNGADMAENYSLKAPVTVATCNVLYGGMNLPVLMIPNPSRFADTDFAQEFTKDLNNSTRTDIMPGASPCSGNVNTAGAAGWSMGAYEYE